MILQQVRLGNSGLKISPIIVGCMSFGSKDWANWVLDDKEKIFALLKYCYDNGMRTFDTADAYSNGLSERLLGEFLTRYEIRRETVVILTKIYFPVDEALPLAHKPVGGLSAAHECDLANQRGLSRKHILAGVAQSCERLGTYIDVLQIHRLDYDTPMEEIMRALNDTVESGQVRYIGASSMLATEFVELQSIAEQKNWHKFISMQSCYNLLYREDERELVPYAKRHNIGLIPWSPNARGVLCRLANQNAHSARYKSDHTLKTRQLDLLQPNETEIVARVHRLAQKHAVPMAVVSTAWVLSKGGYPIVGLSSIAHVQDIIQALHFTLTNEEILFLEQPYHPKALQI